MEKRLLLIFSVILVLVLAACGNADAKDEATTALKKESTYTIGHSMGKTEIKGEPKRIVVLTNEGTEALLALGIKPVGAVKSWLGNPWYDHIKDDMADVEVVGTELEVNIEKIAALKPDLIIGNKVRQEAIYDKLQAIAPTVFSENLTGNWKNNFELYAKTVQQEEKGEKVLADFDNNIADLKGKLGDTSNKTVSVVRFVAGTSYLYYTDSFSGVIFDQLGFKRPEAQAELFGENNKLGNFSVEVGKEVIPKFDADYLFYFAYTVEGDTKVKKTEEKWLNDSMWKNLNVVKEGHAYEVSDAVWNTAGGVLAANEMLKDVEKSLVK
ncbi:iron-siderophore ABC transporter substrate-binding protein [Bacillus sp. DX4.1]|uniref:ABC transporter substrate-binding protein n=1 Tax=Bacillus sp. DX4.1 TaxID=3055867 RepID=UPI0025A13805|nr:iron-siderophore ABC transporter substrate-binding protein [Bacillus sp. DX4.1]MDM5189447.1 iron-siderophore ABC transporter substrate-binding protein [Bacillus sp. DX4.1]